MDKVAFYIMNANGYYTVKCFIEKFGVDSIAYIVSSEDIAIKEDFFEEIRILAEKSKIKFYNRIEDISESGKLPRVYKFTIGWRWLIKNENNLIVFHDSLLPKYRGFAPLVNSLINGERRVGVTALLASGEYDKGDIIAQKHLDVKYPIKISEARNQIQPLYFYLVSKVFIKIKKNIVLKANKQDENEATYSPWLDSEDYYIDWSWSAQKIKRFVDAVGYPYDGAKAFLDGKIVNFVDVNIESDVIIENRNRHVGKVIFIKNDLPVVVCQKGLIQLVDIKDNKNNRIHPRFRSRFSSSLDSK